MIIDKSKFVKKSGDYAIAQTDGIADPLLLGTATKHEEALSRSFKALAPADIPSRFGGVKRLHWSEKYDGEGAMLFYDEKVDTVAFAAPSGRARIGMKALQEAAAALKAKGIKKALLRGEIYLPTEKGKPRPSIAEVTRASFSTEKGTADKLRLALYDILMLDGKDLREDGGGFDEEWNKLGELFGEDHSKPVHRALGGWCSGEELGKVLDQILAGGGEGIVVRHEKERDYAKIKPRLTIDAAIMGYVEGSFDGKIGVRNILVGLTYPAKDETIVFQALARTGSGIDDKMSIDLLERLKGMKTAAPLLLNDSEGREVHFVKPEIIVEIDGEDWIHNRSDGRP
jgi:ATP-dependent DNA ligase